MAGRGPKGKGKKKEVEKTFSLHVCGGRGEGSRPLDLLERFIEEKKESVSTTTGAKIPAVPARWEPATPMAQKRYGFACAVADGRHLYVCGGYDGQPMLETAAVYDSVKQTWETLPVMSQKRAQAVAGVIAGKVYVCGGYDGFATLDSCERYDPNTESWETVTAMNHKRMDHCACVMDDVLYVCGGANGGKTLSSVECYDVSTGSWKDLEPMQESRRGAAVAALRGELWVCGGHSGVECLNTFECYIPGTIPGTNIWVFKDGLRHGETYQVEKMQQRRFGAFATSNDQQIYVCGGHNGIEILDSVELMELPPDDPKAKKNLAPKGKGKGKDLPLVEWVDMPIPLTERRSMASFALLQDPPEKTKKKKGASGADGGEEDDGDRSP